MRIEHLSKTYGNKPVLSVDAFDFQPGLIYGVIGANGSGKSTMAKLIAGVVKADQPHSFPDRDDFRIGYMPQKSYPFQRSTLGNVLLGSSAAGSDTERERAMELLTALEIADLADQKATSLSGGENARMALARVLMGEHDVLILDEPTAAMDVHSTLLAEAVIRRYREERQCAVILVTHSLKQASRMADVVLFFHEGTLLEWGDAKQVLNHPREALTAEFLDFYRI